MNVYLRVPYFLMDFCELGTEKLHITPFCKYQIYRNRSSGSHSLVQGVNRKKEIKSLLVVYKFSLPSEHNPVQNMFRTICWVTVL